MAPWAPQRFSEYDPWVALAGNVSGAVVLALAVVALLLNEARLIWRHTRDSNDSEGVYSSSIGGQLVLGGLGVLLMTGMGVLMATEPGAGGYGAGLGLFGVLLTVLCAPTEVVVDHKNQTIRTAGTFTCAEWPLSQTSARLRVVEQHNFSRVYQVELTDGSRKTDFPLDNPEDVRRMLGLVNSH